MDNGEIDLIPRPRRALSSKERAEYAKKMQELELQNSLKDTKYIKKSSRAFEDKIKRDLMQLKGALPCQKNQRLNATPVRNTPRPALERRPMVEQEQFINA